MRLSEILQLNERREQADSLIAAIKLGMSPDGQKFHDAEDFLSWVREIGGQEVGQGAYAIVYRGDATEDHYVLKLSYGFDPWNDFASYCYQNPGIVDKNPLFPRVLFYISTPPWAPTRAPAWVSGGVAVLEGLTVDQKKAEQLLGARSIYEFKDTMKQTFKALMLPVGAGDAARADYVCARLGVSPQDVISFYHTMVEVVGRTWLRNFDVHSLNIGWRENGQVVFFDPVS
jgi:hypothetical protein